MWFRNAMKLDTFGLKITEFDITSPWRAGCIPQVFSLIKKDSWRFCAHVQPFLCVCYHFSFHQPWVSKLHLAGVLSFLKITFLEISSIGIVKPSVVYWGCGISEMGMTFQCFKNPSNLPREYDISNFVGSRESLSLRNDH